MEGIGSVIILFIAGLAVLMISSNIFVEAAIKIAERLRVPEIIIGSTIVAIGTTLPELMVSVTAATQGHSQMALGNALGSVICNTALIAGFAQLIRPSELEYKSFRRSCCELILVAAIYCFMVMTYGGLTKVCGYILLGLYVVYMVRSYRYAQKMRVSVSHSTAKREPVLMQFVLLFAMAVLLYMGANLIVNNGQVLALYMGVPEYIVSLTMVALGTSLPELITAINALVKGHGSLSLGNIIGANLMNLLIVSGASSAIMPITAGKEVIMLDLPVMLLVLSVLMVPALIRKKISRWQGALLLLGYATYIAYLFGRG
ncbi:calcium/sodium antiporter [Clostridia bacterium OttesenSCG-928-F22]|nr:calcium/sodium antiporter [Clostridia bacterium OttesenSCG-928-F22]